MPPVVIDNPILNPPFAEPAHHFWLDEDGITSEVAEGRRSTSFIPIPRPKINGGAPLSLPGDWVGLSPAVLDRLTRVASVAGAVRLPTVTTDETAAR